MESLKNLHEKEIQNLNIQLTQKQTLMDETDSKMNMISVYVDQLEERLATFALARRDIETREERCKDLEDKTAKNLEELGQLQNELIFISQERDEVKNLVELMVKERTALEKNKVKLEEEIKIHMTEGENMRTQIRNLDGELGDMKKQISELTMRIGEMESLKEQSDGELHSLRNLRDSYDALIEQAKIMENEIGLLRGEKEEATCRTLAVEADKRSIEDQLASTLAELSSYQTELETARKGIVELDPLSPISILWDQLDEFLAQPELVWSTRGHGRAFNIPWIQSMAPVLYNTMVRISQHD